MACSLAAFALFYNSPYPKNPRGKCFNRSGALLTCKPCASYTAKVNGVGPLSSQSHKTKPPNTIASALPESIRRVGQGAGLICRVPAVFFQSLARLQMGVGMSRRQLVRPRPSGKWFCRQMLPNSLILIIITAHEMQTFNTHLHVPRDRISNIAIAHFNRGTKQWWENFCPFIWLGNQNEEIAIQKLKWKFAGCSFKAPNDTTEHKHVPYCRLYNIFMAITLDLSERNQSCVKFI